MGKPSDTPQVPVSWGELIDKLTILEIKKNRLSTESARQNVVKELRLLEAVFSKLDCSDTLVALKKRLQDVNEALWAIEDGIREKERQKDFGDEFIGLARSVYVTNDKRSAIKREINELLKSDLTEEKSYKSY